MPTPLYPTFKKRIHDAIEQLITKQITPWSFLTAGPPFRVTTFDGRKIAYQGVGFEGSPETVFWGRYIEPFLEDLCISEISAAVSMASARDIDGRLLLRELQRLLSDGFRKVYSHMSDVDCRLRGKGYPHSVAPRSVDTEIQRMGIFLDERIASEIEMWRSKTMPDSDLKRLRLVVQLEEAQRKIAIQIEKGRLILDRMNGKRAGSGEQLDCALEEVRGDQERWAKYSIDLLKSLFADDSAANEFGTHWINYSLHGDQLDELESWMKQQITRLQSIKDRLPLFPIVSTGNSQPMASTRQVSTSKDIFVVHGHDSAAKLEIARFLEKLGLNPIILHEKPDNGRTVIEKFEANTNVGFAVVLLTPDDTGYPKDDSSKAKSRARQNVILELGFFVGKLGRQRVCALKKGDIEIPTDYSGVLYKTLDDQGGWKLELAKEIKEAGMEVDLNKAL